jgi:hypothetical protein
MRAERFKLSASGQMRLPAAARRRSNLDDGGQVDVIDLGFGVLTLPPGGAARLLDQILSAEDHDAAVVADDDPTSRRRDRRLDGRASTTEQPLMQRRRQRSVRDHAARATGALSAQATPERPRASDPR